MIKIAREIIADENYNPQVPQKQQALISQSKSKQIPRSSQRNHYSKSPDEFTGMQEHSSNRYSEVVFKDNVFDNKNDSTSEINELNLLQELTNFTNMKMLKNKHSKQHCIHFDRVIKN